MPASLTTPGWDASAGLWAWGRVVGPATAALDVSGALAPGGAAFQGFAGAGAELGPVSFGVGLGLHSVRVTDGDGARVDWLPYPAVSAALRLDGRWAPDVGLGGGASAAAIGGWARLGLRAPGKALRPRFGVEARTALGQYASADVPELGALVGRWSVVAQVGLAWGAR